MSPAVSSPSDRSRLAVLAADAASHTRLMAIDGRLTAELLDAARAVFRRSGEEHQGRVVDMAGGSVLMSFEDAASALRCALLIQQRLAAQADPQTGTLRLAFGIGVHFGEVIATADGLVRGDAVEVAVRLQSWAEPDEVNVSQAVCDALGAQPVARFEDVGMRPLEHPSKSLQVWRARPLDGDGPARPRAPAAVSTDPVRFAGRFELRPLERRLLVDGHPAALGSRAFDLLMVLVEQPGRLLTRNELLQRVWSGLVVEDGNLATQISALRKVLGGDLIVTIPGHGYRFTAALEGGACPTATAPADTTASASASPAVEVARLKTNLPATLPHLLGRAEEMGELGELIDQHRLVSILGAGGVGKTTVALHLTAHRQSAYRHGVCWVELATVTDADALPAAIGAALGVHIGNGDPLEGLCAALAPLTVLVALDNAEQVVDGLARVAQAVLDKAPGVRFVVTSQAPLKLATERAFRIGGLGVPPGPLSAAQALAYGAVALFTDRAQAADTRFTLTDTNAPAVIELCRRLDGVALAIELAAARAPLLGVQRLASSMGDRLKVLTTSRNRLAPPRQQTLRATLEWSHGFLDAHERAVFRRLAVFAGSASLSLLQQVVADPEGALDEWAVLDALALLVDRSLVLVITPCDAVEPRYRLLETPRLFALEKLKEAGEEARLRQRHARAVAGHFEAAHETFYAGTTGGDEWQSSLAADLDNGREALAWARAADDAVAVLQVATTMGLMGRVLSNGGYRELLVLIDAVEPLIERTDSADLLARVCRLIIRALGDNQRGRAVQLARRCVVHLPPLRPDDGAQARWAHHRALAALAIIEARGGELVAAETALEQARALSDPSWPPVRAFLLVQAEAFVAPVRGDMAAFLHWARLTVAMDRARGSSDGSSLGNLVDAELAAGNAEQAVATGSALEALMAGGRDERGLSIVRLNLGAALLAMDEPERACPHLQSGWTLAPLFDLQPYYADHLALLAALDGRPEAAARLVGYADVSNARSGEREPNEIAARARAVQRARATLGDAMFDRLHAEGRALLDTEIGALAFPG